MACDNCNLIGRRAFLESTLAALGASALAACAPTDFTAPSITGFTVKLADFPSLAAVGGIALVDSGSRSGQPIAVAHTTAGNYVALSLVCPHRGTTVSVVNGNTSFYCTGHGATFAANGNWTGGQLTSNLATYSLHYDQAAGTLQIG